MFQALNPTALVLHHLFGHSDTDLAHANKVVDGLTFVHARASIEGRGACSNWLRVLGRSCTNCVNASRVCVCVCLCVCVRVCVRIDIDYVTVYVHAHA